MYRKSKGDDEKKQAVLSSKKKEKLFIDDTYERLEELTFYTKRHHSFVTQVNWE